MNMYKVCSIIESSVIQSIVTNYEWAHILYNMTPSIIQRKFHSIHLAFPESQNPIPIQRPVTVL